MTRDTGNPFQFFHNTHRKRIAFAPKTAWSMQYYVGVPSQPGSGCAEKEIRWAQAHVTHWRSLSSYMARDGGLSLAVLLGVKASPGDYSQLAGKEAAVSHPYSWRGHTKEQYRLF